MKKAILIAMFSLMMVSTAIAIPLLPGGSVVPTGAALPAGSLVDSLIGIPFSTAFYSGVVSQWVYSNSTGMLFAYQFTNSGTSQDVIEGLTTSSFSGWSTDVDAIGANSPSGINRTPFGTITFDFHTAAYWINPGDTSSLLWIQTNAPSYSWGTTTFQNAAVTTVNTFAPVPEPGSLMLLGTGLLGMIGYGKVRFGKKA